MKWDLDKDSCRGRNNEMHKLEMEGDSRSSRRREWSLWNTDSGMKVCAKHGRRNAVLGSGATDALNRCNVYQQHLCETPWHTTPSTFRHGWPCMCVCQAFSEGSSISIYSNFGLVTAQFVWKLVPSGAATILNTARGALHRGRKIFGQEWNKPFVADGIWICCTVKWWDWLILLPARVASYIHVLRMQLKTASAQTTLSKNSTAGCQWRLTMKGQLVFFKNWTRRYRLILMTICPWLQSRKHLIGSWTSVALQDTPIQWKEHL